MKLPTEQLAECNKDLSRLEIAKDEAQRTAEGERDELRKMVARKTEELRHGMQDAERYKGIVKVLCGPGGAGLSCAGLSGAGLG